jgi:hypothetical protein
MTDIARVLIIRGQSISHLFRVGLTRPTNWPPQNLFNIADFSTDRGAQ